jgi:hypothetical protein
MWVTKTKKGRKAFPYNEKRHEKSVNKGMVFPDHSGRFRDKDGNYIYVSKKNPTRYYTHTEHQDHVKSRKGGPNRDQNQKGRQGQKHQNQKKKKSKNGKVDSALINLIKAFKSHADEPKSKGSPFPNLSSFQNPSLAEFETAFGAFKLSFDNSENDFVGRNMVKTWPKDLAGWKFPEAVEDLNANYKQFYQHASKLIRGVAQLLTSTRNYKKSVHESNILAKAIAKANLFTEELTMEQLKEKLNGQKLIALHSEKHIFAILPSLLRGVVQKDDNIEKLVSYMEQNSIVDFDTMTILANNKYKILRRVLKIVKKPAKKDNPPPPAAGQESQSQFRIGSHGLVGMSSAHVF